MKVFLLVAVDVAPPEGGKPQDPQQVKEAVREAVFNALDRVQSEGFDHRLSDEVALLVDSVEVRDLDQTDSS